MALITGTAFQNAAANGYITADGFLGAPSSTDVNDQRLSTQPAQFQNGLTSAGVILANGGITGVPKTLPQIVNAAGSNSQSAATAVTAGYIIVATVTATTRAIRLTAMATGNSYNVFNDTGTAVKVYPVTNGTISSSSTNTAVQIAAHKATEFYCRSALHVVTQVGN